MPSFGWFNVATFGKPKEVSPTSNYPKIWITYDSNAQLLRVTTGEPQQFPDHALGRMHTGLPHGPRMRKLTHELDEWGRILNLQISGPVGKYGPMWFRPLEDALALHLEEVLTCSWRFGVDIAWVEFSLPKLEGSGWA